MDSNDNIPEEYLDIVKAGFHYDPIKFSYEEDPYQVLYNRRALEAIWDTEHIAINPYTFQPFEIHSVIPQSELKQQMCKFLVNNRSVTLRLGLQVIPDYTQILNETEMKQLLNELVLAGKQCLRLVQKKNRLDDRNRNGTPDEKEIENWNALWRKVNLVRLYCQYRPENRETFSLIKGYKYLFQVINIQLLHSGHEYSGSSCDDAKEVLKEIARIVDVMGGLNEKDLSMVPERAVLAFVCILFHLTHSEYLKIRSMVLRICRGMLEDCGHYFMINNENSIGYMVKLALHVLWQNPWDITNEDLYNATAILNAANCINRIRVFVFPNYVIALSTVVRICVSRFQELHDAQTISTSSCSTSSQEDNKYFTNVHLIGEALEKGLFLIYYLLTHDHNSEDEPEDILPSMDIVDQIIRTVELSLAGNKFIQSSHLHFGLKITAAPALRGLRRSEHLQVLRNFLESKLVNEHGTEVKLLLQRIAPPFPKESFKRSFLSGFMQFFDCLRGA